MIYRPEIDGLRAVAVLPVMLFHGGFEGFGGGFVGVDVFFVISGYLITSIILADKEKGRFSLLTFYERRARRILPALFFVMVACLPLAWTLLGPSELKDFSQSLFSVVFFASNFLFWIESGYFDAAAELKPLLHTWSLAVEEQFYLVFPLLLMLFWRLGRKAIFIGVTVIGAASLALAEAWASSFPSAGFFLLPTRAWELMLGALAAIYFTSSVGQTHRLGKNPLANDALSWLGLVLILASVLVFNEELPFPSVYTLAPTLGTLLIILFSSPATTSGRLLGSGLLVGLGLISYSAYLWHQPLFVFARHYNAVEPRPEVFAGLIVITIFLAYLSWHYIERPFRGKNRIGRKRVFQFAVAGSCIFAIGGTAGHISNGFLKQKTTDHQRTLLASAQASPKRQECHTDGPGYRKPGDACAYFGAKASWAVFGDSHNVELAYALANELLPDGIGIRHYTISDCIPSYGKDGKDDHCARWTNETVEYIASDPTIEAVVVGYRIHSALFGRHEKVFPKLPNNNSELHRARTWAALEKTLQRFVDSGKHVFFVLQAPELRAPIERLVLKDGYHVKKIVSVERAWWEQRSSYVSNRIASLPRGVSVIDPADLFCDEKYCYAAVGLEAYYFDDDHMSVVGASKVAEEIRRRLQQAPINEHIPKKPTRQALNF
ncbi:MAG: acyltransferase family protein [Gammaproteobacteria bacterium]|nr:acyltransferase family protein [Gammaproteobacteria bacterium]